MKYVAERGYTDVQLNRHVEKGAELEEEYKKDNVELTEERVKYLVEERKLYVSVEDKVEDVTQIDKVVEEKQVVDRVNIVEDKRKTTEEMTKIEQKEETKTETKKEDEEETKVENITENKTKNTTKSVKNNAKN